jgi:hypothetical protein
MVPYDLAAVECFFWDAAGKEIKLFSSDFVTVQLRAFATRLVYEWMYNKTKNVSSRKRAPFSELFSLQLLSRISTVDYFARR